MIMAGSLDNGEARPPHPALTAELAQADLRITGRLVQASNATFLAELQTAGAPIECVYKPFEGERPLWDFPHRTLGLREVAAYEVSRIGGFDCVPVTVLIDGPFGPGSLQVWVEVDEAASSKLVDLVPSSALPMQGWFSSLDGFDGEDRPVSVIHADVADLRMLAVFDVLINNADRKGVCSELIMASASIPIRNCARCCGGGQVVNSIGGNWLPFARLATRRLTSSGRCSLSAR